MASRVRVVLQARTSSSRLPGKVLLPIGGMPLAILCARRLGVAGHDVVLATSEDHADDLLALTAERAGLKIFRGSLDNVLDRFVQCVADLSDGDIVVRATADNPLPDGNFIGALLQAYGEIGGNYLGAGWPTDGLPYGLSAEVMSVGALRRTAEGPTDALDREHVTPRLRRQAGVGGVVQPGWLLQENVSHLRATIDTLDDYLAMASAFDDVVSPTAIDWKALIPRLPVGRLATTPIPNVCRNGDIYGTIMLGTAQLGMNYGVTNLSGQPNDAETAAMLALAMKAGVTHLDTARAYGNAESRIGRLLPANARDTTKIVTKLQPLDAIPDDAPEREIKSTVDASVYGSCRDLRREQLDVLMFHRSADMYRWRGAAIARVEDHVARGVVRALGVSAYTPAEAIKGLADNRITHLQVPFNLLDARWLDGEFLEALVQRQDVCVHVRSVFLQGILINQAAIWPSWVAQREELIQRIEALAKEFGRKSTADLCMAYVRSFPWVTTVVLGVETLQQLKELLSLAAEPLLAQEQLRAVQACFSDVPTRLLNPSQW